MSYGSLHLSSCCFPLAFPAQVYPAALFTLLPILPPSLSLLKLSPLSLRGPKGAASCYVAKATSQRSRQSRHYELKTTCHVIRDPKRPHVVVLSAPLLPFHQTPIPRSLRTPLAILPGGVSVTIHTTALPPKSITSSLTRISRTNYFFAKKSLNKNCASDNMFSGGERFMRSESYSHLLYGA